MNKPATLILGGLLTMQGCQESNPPFSHNQYSTIEDTADTGTDTGVHSDKRCEIALAQAGDAVTWKLETEDSGLTIQSLTSWYQGAVERTQTNMDADGSGEGSFDFLPHRLSSHSIQEGILSSGGSLETRIQVEAKDQTGKTICENSIVVPFQETNLPDGIKMATNLNLDEESQNLFGDSSTHFGLKILRGNMMTDPRYVIVTDLVTGDVFKSYEMGELQSDLASAHFTGEQLILMTNAYPGMDGTDFNQIIILDPNGEEILSKDVEAESTYLHHRFVFVKEGSEIKLIAPNWTNTGDDIYDEDSTLTVSTFNQETGDIIDTETIFNGDNLFENPDEVAQYCNSVSLSEGGRWTAYTCAVDNMQTNKESRFELPYIVIRNNETGNLDYIMVRQGYLNEFDLSAYPNITPIQIPDSDGNPPMDFLHDMVMQESNGEIKFTIYDIGETTGTRADTYTANLTNSEIIATRISSFGSPEDSISNGNLIQIGNKLVGIMVGNTSGSIYWINSDTGENIGQITANETPTYQHVWMEQETWEDAGINATQSYDFNALADYIN